MTGLRLLAASGVGLIIAGLALPPANAASRKWSASGSGQAVAVTDCADCGDDIGMMISCRGTALPATVTVQWVAAERGQEGALLPLTVNIDGQVFKHQATTRLYGQIGYTPEFLLSPGDPMIEALQAGQRARVRFSGGETTISLRGTRSSIDIFKEQCGWNDAAQAQAEDQAASAEPLVAEQADGDDAKWFSGQYTSDQTGKTTAYVSYAVPETDAVAFNAGCEAGTKGPQIPVMLIVDYGKHRDDALVQVNFRSGAFDATYAGTVTIASSEHAGVRLLIGVDDPLWPVLTGSGEIAFGASGLPTVTVPLQGAAKPVTDFLEACRAQFAAYDAAAPASVLITQAFTCDDGSQLRASFDNSRSYSVAMVSHAGQPDIPLIQVAARSGAKYSNGDYTLHTKADEALFGRENKLLLCKAN